MIQIIKRKRPPVLAPSARHESTLPAGHPCMGCAVRTAAVCGVLDCEKLSKLRGLGNHLRLGAGQPLFHEGDPAMSVFTLTSGAIKLYKLLPDGRRQVTGFMQPGDFLGISVDDEHAFTAEALEHSQLCSFPRSRFDNFVEENVEVERELYRLAAHELAAAQQQMVLLGRKTATERVASFLLMLAGRCSWKFEGDIILPMSRADIADYLGLRIETVSREITGLKTSRIIRLTGRQSLRIVDRARLEELAEQ